MADLYEVTVYLHLLSFLLTIPLGYSQYRLQNTLLFVFSILLSLFHVLQLQTLLVFGNHMSLKESPVGWCVVRKGIFVYLGQSVYWFSALIAGRLWMIVSGREVAKVDAKILEKRLAWGGVLIPLIPALLATLPQAFNPPTPDKTFTGAEQMLNRCSQGYIKPWQVFAAGAGFSLLPTIACLVFIALIVYHIYRLLRMASMASPQFKASTLAMAIRVLLLCVAIGVVGGYYIVADFNRYFGRKSVVIPFFKSSPSNGLGHLLISIWGTLYFLIFGTTPQSRQMLLGGLSSGGDDEEDDAVAGKHVSLGSRLSDYKGPGRPLTKISELDMHHSAHGEESGSYTGGTSATWRDSNQSHSRPF